MGLFERKLPCDSRSHIRFTPGTLLTGINTLNLCRPATTDAGILFQGNYHFMPAFLTKLSPKRFGEGSTFTAVVRYDRVNLNRDNRGENQGELEQISFGLNYRPVEDMAFKMSYQYMPKAFNPNTENGSTTAPLLSQLQRISNPSTGDPSLLEKGSP